MPDDEIPGGIGGGFGPSRTRSFSMFGKNVASFGTKFEFKVPGLTDTTKDIDALNKSLNDLQKVISGLSSSSSTTGVKKFFSTISDGAKTALGDMRKLQNGFSSGGGSSMFAGGATAGSTGSFAAGTGASGTNEIISSIFDPVGEGRVGPAGMVQTLGEMLFKPVQLAYNRVEENRAATMRSASYLGPISSRMGRGSSIEMLMDRLSDRLPIQGQLDDILGALGLGTRMGLGVDFTNNATNAGFWTAARQFQQLNPAMSAPNIVGMLGGQIGNVGAVQKSVMFSGGAFSFQKSGGGQKSIQDWAEGLIRFFQNQRPGQARGKPFTREELGAQQFPGSNINAWFALNEVTPELQDAFWQYALSKTSSGGGTWDEIVGTRGADLMYQRLQGESALARRDLHFASSVSTLRGSAPGTGTMYSAYSTRESADRQFQNLLNATLDSLVPQLAGALGINQGIGAIPTPIAEMLYRLMGNLPAAAGSMLSQLDVEAFGFGVDPGQGGKSTTGTPGGRDFGDPGYGPTGATSTFGMTPAMSGRLSAMMQANPNLVINSGYRDGGTQSRLFSAGVGAVAPPGQSTHAHGIAADIGPESEYGWIAANAGRFGLQVAGDEPWHVGLPGSMPVMGDPRRRGYGVGIGDNPISNALGWVWDKARGAMGGLGGAVGGALSGVLPNITDLLSGFFKSGGVGKILGLIPGLSGLFENPIGTILGFLGSGGGSNLLPAGVRSAPGITISGAVPASYGGGGAGLGGGDGSRTVSSSFNKFGTDLLAALGLPPTTSNLRAINAWAQAEGTRAANNPLATTQRMEGATNFNSVGVKNYTSYEQGVAATAKTLRNGRYDNVLAAFKAGNSAKAVGSAVAASPWGTGQGLLRVLGDPSRSAATASAMLAGYGYGGSGGVMGVGGGRVTLVQVTVPIQTTRGTDGDLRRVASRVGELIQEQVQKVDVHG